MCTTGSDGIGWHQHVIQYITAVESIGSRKSRYSVVKVPWDARE